MTDYKEFCVSVGNKLGVDNIHWGLMGKLYKMYTAEHIYYCVGLIPQGKKFTPFKRMLYLMTLCKNKSSSNVMKANGKRIDIDKGDFKI